MEQDRERFNLITPTGKGATTSLLPLLALMTIISYHATIALPEGTFPIAKRMNIETCLVRFDVHLNTIIRTEESRSMGARFLDDADLNSREQCLRLCCETVNCDVFVFEEKVPLLHLKCCLDVRFNDPDLLIHLQSPGTCFLFQCGPPENFRCKFTHHSNYTSAVLSIPPPPMEQPPPPPPLAAQIQSLAAQTPTNNGGTKPLSQHEMELVSLKDGGTGNNKLMAANFATASSTTPLPPLGVRLGEIPTTLSPSTPKQQFPVAQQCGHFEFPCHSGECIAVYNVCDGIPQCEDGSDEGTECPQKNPAAPIISPAAVQGKDQGSGLGMANMNVGVVNQPIMMIPSVRAGANGNNPIGMVSQGMLPIEQQIYQPMDYQQPPNRFGLSLEQQQQQLVKPILHRNREDPMTAPKPWPRPTINEANYIDSSDSHIFNHKGGLQLTAVNNLVPQSQQYQETLPESNYMPSSSVIRGGGGKSYLAIPNSNSYSQQVSQQYPPEQPQQQPSYKSVLSSQWMGNNMHSSWPLQPGDNVPSNNVGAPPQEQYIQPPVQQRHPSISMQDIQSTAIGVDAPSISSSGSLQQPAVNQPPPSGIQWASPVGTQTGPGFVTPTPGIPVAGDGTASRTASDSTSKDSTTGHESLPVSGLAVQNGAKHKSSSSDASSDGGVEYEEDTYEDTYPESTNAAGTADVEDQLQTATQTEPPKKKNRKHHKHDHEHGSKQVSSNTVSSTANDQPEQKKKKKTKIIKKDKAATQADHSTSGSGHRIAGSSDPIVHEHLKALHKDLEIEFADHDGYADRPGGAMLSLTLGVLLTAAMGILLSCRMRVARRRIRRPGKSSYAHDADFLVNGMYL